MWVSRSLRSVKIHVQYAGQVSRQVLRFIMALYPIRLNVRHCQIESQQDYGQQTKPDQTGQESRL
jgi:hypothetical protein